MAPTALCNKRQFKKSDGACGDGVIDWARVIKICRKAKRDIVFSIECGTIPQAERRLKHLMSLL